MRWLKCSFWPQKRRPDLSLSRPDWGWKVRHVVLNQHKQQLWKNGAKVDAARQAYCFYFYVRIAYTLNTGIYWYSITTLVFEFLASSSMLVHGLGLLRVRDMRGRTEAPPLPCFPGNSKL